jgi:hypothetical protein
MTVIGRCKGCDRSAVLIDGICQKCLTDPRRGPRWAELAARCRKEPAIALQVYHSLNTDMQKKLFVIMFGCPPGIESPFEFSEEHEAGAVITQFPVLVSRT